MPSPSLFFLFGLLIFIVSANRNTNWGGVWVDKCADNDCFGGTLEVCVVGNNVFGRYSNIGFLRGVIKNDRVVGMWYEAGYSQYNSGGFEWRYINEDIGAFTGSWWYTSRKCERFGWSSQRINTLNPSELECGFMNERNDSFTGYWRSDSEQHELWLCRDSENFFHGSGKFHSNSSVIDVNLSGQFWEMGLVLTGNYWSSQMPNGKSGIVLFLMISDSNNNLVLLGDFWDVEVNELALNQFSDGLHNSFMFSQVSGTTVELCDINNNIGGLTWAGAFTDPQNGSGLLFVCLDEFGNVQGTFSELGWIEGTLTSNDIISGSFYNAGSRSFDSGTFTMELTNNGHSYEGFFNVAGIIFSWRGNRVDATSYYSTSSCWITPSFGTLAGQWYYGKEPGDTFDVCINDDNSVEISYTYNGQVQGYGIGKSSASGPQSIQVTWFEDEADGIAIYRLQDDSHMLESLWAKVNSVDNFTFEICQNNRLDFQYWGRHSVNRLKLLSPVQSQVRCSRNRDLYDPYFFLPDSPDSSSSILSYSIVFLFILYLLQF